MYLCLMKTHTVKGKEKLEDIMKEGKESGLIHISFSEFKLHTECAHRHLVEKHLKLVEQPPSIHLYFGSAVHEAIEHGIEQGFGPERRAKYFRDMFIKDMKDNIPEHPEEEVNQFVEQGENILKILDVEGIIEEYEIISVEEPLYEHIYDRFYFKGFVDLVVKDRKTGRIIIIDWKTSGNSWNMFYKNKDWAFWMQMRFYKYFWCRKNGVELDDVDCKYIVLNRLKDKKKPEGGFEEVSIDVDSIGMTINNSISILSNIVKGLNKNTPIDANLDEIKTNLTSILSKITNKKYKEEKFKSFKKYEDFERGLKEIYAEISNSNSILSEVSESDELDFKKSNLTEVIRNLDKALEVTSKYKKFGEIEEVEIPSTQIQIKEAVNALGRSLKNIYKDKRFRKAKFTLDNKGNVKLDSHGQPVLDESPCKFCPLKGGKHSLCNSNFYQDKLILKENKRIF